jgi:hypothetical protein
VTNLALTGWGCYKSNLLISEIVGFVERGSSLHVKQRKENGEKLKKEIRW